MEKIFLPERFVLAFRKVPVHHSFLKHFFYSDLPRNEMQKFATLEGAENIFVIIQARDLENEFKHEEVAVKYNDYCQLEFRAIHGLCGDMSMDELDVLTEKLPRESQTTKKVLKRIGIFRKDDEYLLIYDKKINRIKKVGIDFFEI